MSERVCVLKGRRICELFQARLGAVWLAARRQRGRGLAFGLLCGTSLGVRFVHTPANIEPSNVGDYLDTALELDRGVCANRENATLSVMFAWLIRMGPAGVKPNPCTGINRNRETKRGRYGENEEKHATLADAPVQVWTLAHLVYRTLQHPEDIIG